MIALELFGCSGGMAEGFRRAGLTFTHAFDWDADACASYAANMDHVPIRMDVRDLVRLAAAGWSPCAPVDLLVADPPCTPWSRAGKRKGLADERDMLVETCDLIRHLRPTRFLILQGLPEGWIFHGKTKASRWSQIGMAMPPPLAHAVATSIRAAMEAA